MPLYNQIGSPEKRISIDVFSLFAGINPFLPEFSRRNVEQRSLQGLHGSNAFARGSAKRHVVCGDRPVGRWRRCERQGRRPK